MADRYATAAKDPHGVKERCRDVIGQENHEIPDNHRLESEIK